MHANSSFCDSLARWAQIDPLPSCFPYPPSYLPPYPLPLLPFYFPTLLFQYTYSTDFPSHPNAPIHIVYQSCPPTPHFRFFGSFLAITLLPAPSLTIIYLLQLFLKACYPLPDPFHSPAPTCPPVPIFAFLNDLWAFFACISFPFYLYMYIMITGIKYREFDRFFGV